MLLVDFADPNEVARWRATDDVVMGGQSSSAVLAGHGVGIFTGHVSLERGGGFASVRRADHAMDLSTCDLIVLHVRGDGRRYKLNVRTSETFDGVVYQAAFATQPGVWSNVELLLEDFEPRFRGRPVEGAFDRARVASLGVLISDQQAGPFRLEMSAIAGRSLRESDLASG